MDDTMLEQPLEEAAASLDAAAAPADSEQEDAAVDEAAPVAKKWANLFDTPEKLEEAYSHIYKAFHARSQELQQTRSALEQLAQAVVDGAGPQAGSAPAFADAGSGFPVQGSPLPVDAQQPAVDPRLIAAVAESQQAAAQARELGERFLYSALENQVRGFFKEHSELGTSDEALDRFARETAACLGPVDVDALEKLPEALERAFRIVHYPDAVQEARRMQQEEERRAESFAVEGAGAGSMSVPRNQARETSFRKLVQRLKAEQGYA